VRKPRIQLANSFTYEQVSLLNSLFTKLSMGQDVRGLLRTSEYARLRQKFQQMGDKHVMGVVDPGPVFDDLLPTGEC
jgi:hypothetical protein